MSGYWTSGCYQSVRLSDVHLVPICLKSRHKCPVIGSPVDNVWNPDRLVPTGRPITGRFKIRTKFCPVCQTGRQVFGRSLYILHTNTINCSLNHRQTFTINTCTISRGRLAQRKSVRFVKSFSVGTQVCIQLPAKRQQGFLCANFALSTTPTLQNMSLIF